MSDRRYRLLFILNILNPGTGPFQRAVRLDPGRLDVTIVSCMDTQDEIAEKSERLLGRECGHRLIGLGAKRRMIFVWRLCRILLEIRPDVIQVNHTFSAAVAIVFSRFLGTPVKVAFEGTLFSRYGLGRRFFLSLLFSLTDGVISVSNAVKNANHLAAGRLGGCINRRVIYNGVDIGESSVPSQNIGATGFVIGYVGDLKPVKDVGTLIRAFARFIKNCPGSTLLIIGGGDMEEPLRKLASELKALDRIIFTGQIERSQVYALLARMDVFVMPSRVEGLSEAIVQAMAAGVPVVASDIAPNRELVMDGVTGAIFELGNDKALARVLQALAGDAGRRKTFAVRARALVEQELDIYRIAEQYHDYYNELLCSKGLK